MNKEQMIRGGSKIKAAEVQYESEFKRQIEQSNMQVKVKKYGQSVALNQRRSNDFPFFSIKGQDEQLKKFIESNDPQYPFMPGEHKLEPMTNH